MTKITYAILLTSGLTFAGGTIGAFNLDTSIDQKDIDNANQTVISTPPLSPTTTLVPEKPISKESSPNYYLGISGATSNIRTANNNEIIRNSKPTLIIGKLGYNIFENLAIEGRVGTGIQKDSVGFTSNNVQSLVGAFIKPNFQLSNNLNFFGLLGYTQTKMEQAILNSQVDSASYGAGLAYGLNSNFNIVADAVRYGKEGEHKVDVYSLGIEYKF